MHGHRDQPSTPSRPRAGTEPRNARSALRLRLRLSLLFVPLFLAAAGLFWYWFARTGPGDAPGAGSLRVLALVCTALAVLSLVDLAVVRARLRPTTGRRR